MTWGGPGIVPGAFLGPGRALWYHSRVMWGHVVEQTEARALLAEMFRERKARNPAYSFSDFGRDLAAMVGRDTPYPRQYINNVLKGIKGYPVSSQLEAGLQRLAAVEDGQTEFQAKLVGVPSSTLAMHELHEGSIIMGKSVLCARPGCGVWFVRDHPRRKFCPKCHPPKITHPRT